MIRHVRRDRDQIVRRVVREVRDEAATRLSYDTWLAECVFRRDTHPTAAHGAGALHLTPDHAAISALPPGEQERVRATLADLQAAFQRYCTYLGSDRLRGVLRTYIGNLNAIRVRTTGGVYFVHHRHANTLAALRELVRRFGAGSHLSRVPLPDQEEMREMVITAFTTKSREALDRLARDIVAAQHDGGTARAAIEALYKRSATCKPLQPSMPGSSTPASMTPPPPPKLVNPKLRRVRDPFLAEERKAHRERLLAATEAELTKITAMVEAGRLADPAKIGVRAGKVINKRKVAKHFTLNIGERSFTWRRDQDNIDAEAAFDGIYVIRTPIPAGTLDAPAVVAAYKDLAHAESDFKISKDDLGLRPIYHRLEDRVRALMLICMLACYLSWHLRKAWAPLTCTDEHPPQRDNPVAPARRSPSADAKASRKATTAGRPVRGFRDLLDHLATLTRQTITIGGHRIEKITIPTPAQRQAFSLIGATIPTTLE